MDALPAHEIYQAIGRLESSIASLHWLLAAGFTALTVAAGSVGYLLCDLNKSIRGK